MVRASWQDNCSSVTEGSQEQTLRTRTSTTRPGAAALGENCPGCRRGKGQSQGAAVSPRLQLPQMPAGRGGKVGWEGPEVDPWSLGSAPAAAHAGLGVLAHRLEEPCRLSRISLRGRSCSHSATPVGPKAPPRGAGAPATTAGKATLVSEAWDSPAVCTRPSLRNSACCSWCAAGRTAQFRKQVAGDSAPGPGHRVERQ